MLCSHILHRIPQYNLSGHLFVELIKKLNTNLPQEKTHVSKTDFRIEIFYSEHL